VHHPGDLRVAGAQLLQMGFFGGLVLAFVGKNVLPEKIATVLSSNPIATFGGLFAMNVASGKLVNTGAFEITYVDAGGAAPIPCWSKLETGHFPTPEVLAEKVRAAAALVRRPSLETPEEGRTPTDASEARDEL